MAVIIDSSLASPLPRMAMSLVLDPQQAGGDVLSTSEGRPPARLAADRTLEVLVDLHHHRRTDGTGVRAVEERGRIGEARVRQLSAGPAAELAGGDDHDDQHTDGDARDGHGPALMNEARIRLRPGTAAIESLVPLLREVVLALGRASLLAGGRRGGLLAAQGRPPVWSWMRRTRCIVAQERPRSLARPVRAPEGTSGLTSATAARPSPRCVAMQHLVLHNGEGRLSPLPVLLNPSAPTAPAAPRSRPAGPGACARACGRLAERTSPPATASGPRWSTSPSRSNPGAPCGRGRTQRSGQEHAAQADRRPPSSRGAATPGPGRRRRAHAHRVAYVPQAEMVDWAFPVTVAEW